MKKRLIILLVASVLFIAAALSWAAFGIPDLFVPSSSAGVDAVLAACASADNRAECYEHEVSALYPGLSVSEVFDVIRVLRKKDTTYQFCHVLAHKVGERVVAEDPERWIEALWMNPNDGLCSNGFIHGVIGGRFRAEVLDEKSIEALILDFSRACEPHDSWNPSGLDKAMCYHSMGHLYVYITDADLTRALSLCERTARSAHSSEDYRRVCREGVFMQVYQPLEPDDFELLKRLPSVPTASTARQFCAGFVTPEYVGACHRESWPLFAREIIDEGGIGTFCSDQPNASEELACYQSASAIIGRMSLGNPDRAVRGCVAAPPEWRATCFSAAARAVLEENRNDSEGALALCARAEEPVAAECIRNLAQDTPFIFGDDRMRARRFCEALPPEFSSLCR